MTECKEREMLSYLREIYFREGALSVKAIADTAAHFALPCSRVASCAGFYSMINGLPVETVLQPLLMTEGPIISYGREKRWSALSKAETDPHAVIPQIRESGLAGWGGGGFPV